MECLPARPRVRPCARRAGDRGSVPHPLGKRGDDGRPLRRRVSPLAPPTAAFATHPRRGGRERPPGAAVDRLVGMVQPAQLWIPAARHYLDVPMLLRSLSASNPTGFITAGLGLAWLGLASLLGDRVSDRWARPFVDKAAAFCFATVWLAIAYLVFVTLIPAASYFENRLKLVVAVPGLLVTALVLTSTSRALRPSSRLLPVAAMILMLVAAGQIPPRLIFDEPDSTSRDFVDLVGLVRSWTPGAGGRIFASPNDHLVLTYYSGRLVQSIAPVRKEWLDHFGSDLIVIEAPGFTTPNPSEVQETARGLGYELTAVEARSRAIRATWLATALRLTASGLLDRASAEDGGRARSSVGPSRTGEYP